MPDDAVGQELQRRIEAQWGTMDSFKTAFSAQTVAIQGLVKFCVIVKILFRQGSWPTQHLSLIYVVVTV